jgi:hypothetical protein
LQAHIRLGRRIKQRFETFERGGVYEKKRRIKQCFLRCATGRLQHKFRAGFARELSRPVDDVAVGRGNPNID